MAKKYRRKGKTETLLQPVLERYPQVRYVRGTLALMPIGLYLRGLSFERSQWSSTDFYLWMGVKPLFGEVSRMNYSARIPRPQPEYNQGWNSEEEVFFPHPFKIIDEMVLPRVAPAHTGAGFKSYLEYLAQLSHEQRIMRTHWHEPGFAMGLAYLHMGDLEKAHENFLAGKRFVEDFKVHCGHPPTDWVNTADPEEMNLRDLLDLLEHNPDAIPAHCDRVVEACVKANKLEDFWEPVTFSYSGTGGG